MLGLPSKNLCETAAYGLLIGLALQVSQSMATLMYLQIQPLSCSFSNRPTGGLRTANLCHSEEATKFLIISVRPL